MRHANSLSPSTLLAIVVVTLIPGMVAAQTPEEAARIRAATGHEVRVTVAGGTRWVGTLLTLSDTELVVQQKGRRLPLPLPQVRQVERVSHDTRNFGLLGMAGGFAAGLALCGGGDESSCGPEAFFTGLVGAGIGLGIGAAVGAVHKAASSERRVIYRAPGTSPTVVLAPVIGPHHVGFGARLAW